MAFCARCRTLRALIGMRHSDVSQIAKRIARQDIPSQKALGQLSEYKAQLTDTKQMLEDHQRTEH